MIYMGEVLEGWAKELTVELLEVSIHDVRRPLFIQQDFSKE